jgi:hypothetical protein
MSPRPPAVSKVLQKEVMCLTLSSLHDRHMNPVLRNSFPSTYNNTTITSKKSVSQRHVVAPSFFRKPLLLRRYVAAPSPWSKNASVILSCVSRLLSKNAIMYTMSPRLPAIPKHRHTSSCISSLMRLQLRYINPVAELLPVLYNTHQQLQCTKTLKTRRFMMLRLPSVPEKLRQDGYVSSFPLSVVREGGYKDLGAGLTFLPSSRHSLFSISERRTSLLTCCGVFWLSKNDGYHIRCSFARRSENLCFIWETPITRVVYVSLCLFPDPHFQKWSSALSRTLAIR